MYKPFVPTMGYIFNTTERLENDLPYDKSKKDIITIGCSFVRGYGIDTVDTLAYKLQKSTGRRTFNFGTDRHGIQHVIYKIQMMSFFIKKDVNPEYMIYVFITDHMRRMYVDYFDMDYKEKYFKYKNIDEGLYTDTFKLKLSDYFKITGTGKRINNFLYRIKSDNEKFDMFKKHVITAKEITEDLYPGCKFVVIVYNPELDAKGFKPFHTDRWHELEDQGVVVINLDSPKYSYLKDEDYVCFDKQHPSGKAWDSLIPVIRDKLKI